MDIESIQNYVKDTVEQAKENLLEPEKTEQVEEVVEEIVVNEETIETEKPVESTEESVVEEMSVQTVEETKPEEPQESTALMLQEKKKEALQSAEALQIGQKIAVESIKADFANEVAKINEKNTEAAEKELDNKTRQRRLDRLNAELDLQHKYNMSMIKQNGEHKQMLDKRRKLVEKYGYLYDTTNTAKAFDGEGKEYEVPKDFSYSIIVNKFRQFGRNVSKLDKPLLQSIKWVAIIGGIVALIFILKALGI